MAYYKYIGKSRTYNCPATGRKIDLNEGEVYEAEVEYEGPQIIINGVPQVDPNGTLGICFPIGLRMPYAPNLFEKQWQQTTQTSSDNTSHSAVETAVTTNADSVHVEPESVETVKKDAPEESMKTSQPDEPTQ